MKKVIIFIGLIIIGLNASSQLVVDAGKDTTICVGMNFTEAKLENVAISNGEAPYTIKWECNVEYAPNFTLTASNLLKDTTVLTPTIVEPLKGYSNKWILLTVDVTDKNGNHARDSLNVRFSSYKYLLGNIVKEISRGDSVLLQESTVAGGVAPVSYSWQPNEYLIQPDSQTTWAKPQESINYSIVLTDSCGCVSQPSLVYEIRVKDNNSFAQNVVQQWNVGIFDESFSPQHAKPTWHTYIFKSVGDTIINDLQYKKINKSNDSLFSNHVYFGGIRVNSGKVFIRTNNAEKDVLLYDFNLKQQDSTTVYRMNHSLFYPILVTVDSIKYKNLDNSVLKEFYVRYLWQNNEQQDVWLEGIGSIHHGLLNESCFGATGCYTTSYLLCYKEDDALLMQNSEINTCFKESVFNRLTDDSKIQYRVYPSLVTNTDNITIEANCIINSLQIFTANGVLVYSKNPNCFNYDVDLSSLSNGIYIVSVNNKTTKIIKNR